MTQVFQERIKACDTYRAAVVELVLSYADDNDPAIKEAFDVLCKRVGLEVTISADTR